MLFSDPNGPRHTIVAVQRDYPEWHRGRQHYALWSIPVASPLIMQRLQAARALLGDWLHPNTKRQAHITLFVCGFEARERIHDDDFTTEQFEAQQRALEKSAISPYELQIGALDSFASAAFLRVEDPGDKLATLRQPLARHSREIRHEAYLAHLTVGLYRQRIDADQWHRRTAGQLDEIALPLPVDVVDYCSYEATHMQGPLTTRQRVRLAGITTKPRVSGKL